MIAGTAGSARSGTAVTPRSLSSCARSSRRSAIACSTGLRYDPATRCWTSVPATGSSPSAPWIGSVRAVASSSPISRLTCEHCRAAATEAGELSRCDFVTASADNLAGIADSSVDVVTARSVLIYVAAKTGAFAEFRRVLRPGGRISIFEPINTLMQECDAGVFYGYDVRPVAESAAKVQARFAALQPPGRDPMLDFDDRDLVRLAELAGFADVRLDLEVSVRRTRPPVPWDAFLRSSGNPNLPPLGLMLEEALTLAELAAFTGHLRPLVEAGDGTDRRAVAYLTAGGIDAPGVTTWPSGCMGSARLAS